MVSCRIFSAISSTIIMKPFLIRHTLHLLFLLFFLFIFLGATAACNGWQKSQTLNTVIKTALGQKEESSFKFAVLGDSKVLPKQPHYPNNVILLDLLKSINKDDSDFTIYVGDGPDLGGPISYMISFREALNKLKKPWYPVIGNHELSGGASPDGIEGDGEYNFIKVFEDRLPLKDLQGNRVSYYSFDYMNSHFVVLNTAWQDSKGHKNNKLYPGNAQWEWLAQDLEAARPKSMHIFLFGHEPPLMPNKPELADNTKKFSSMYRTFWDDPKAVDAFIQLCQKYRVDAVFSGHFHGYLDFKNGDTTHIITGGAGADLHAPAEAGGYYHYVRCGVEGEHVNYEVIRN